MLRRVLLTTVAAIIAVIITPITANAQVIECQVTGVMIIVAINGPVTVCSIDTVTSDPVQLGPLNISPQHLFLPPPPQEP